MRTHLQLEKSLLCKNVSPYEKLYNIFKRKSIFHALPVEKCDVKKHLKL